MRCRHMWHAALAASLVLTAAACSQPSETTFLGKDRINIGLKNDQPGTGRAAPDYKREGFDYRVGKWVTDELGVVMATRDVTSDDRVPSLNKTFVNDLVIATFSITETRMKQIDFVGPYAETYQGLMVLGTSPVRNWGDLDGRTVCVHSGTTSVQLIKEAAPKSKVVVRDTASQCVEEMVAEENGIVAVSTDQLILYGFAHHYAMRTKGVKKDLKVLPGVTTGAAQMWGIGLPKGHRDDCARLLDIVKDYVGSNEWQEDLKASLPLATERNADWATEFRPSEESILENSCTDP